MSNKVTVHRWARNQKAEDYTPANSHSPPIQTSRKTKNKLNSFNSHYNEQYRSRSTKPIFLYPPSPYPYNQPYLYRTRSPTRSRCLAGWCCTFAIILAILLAIFMVLFTILFITFGMPMFGGSSSSSTQRTTTTTTTTTTTIEPNLIFIKALTHPHIVYGNIVIHRDRVVPGINDDILQFTFHVAAVNATEAASHCVIDGEYLVTFERENDEEDLMREVKNHPAFIQRCADAFIGYRSIQDGEWISMNRDYEAFGGLFSSMWETSVYESGQENCSHAAKVFNYRLNAISCNFPHDCIMCQTEVDCENNISPCFKLEKFPVASIQRAGVHCEKKTKGILAVVPNAKTHEALLSALKLQDPHETCVGVAIGMVLNRQLESFNEVIAKYPPVSLDPTMGFLSDSCVAIVLQKDGVKGVKFVDCKKRTCFVCASRLRTNPTLTTVK